MMPTVVSSKRNEGHNTEGRQRKLGSCIKSAKKQVKHRNIKHQKEKTTNFKKELIRIRCQRLDVRDQRLGPDQTSAKSNRLHWQNKIMTFLVQGGEDLTALTKGSCLGSTLNDLEPDLTWLIKGD